MDKPSLHPDTRLGYVHLTVSDLNRALQFYERSMGFKVRARQNGTARLGAGGEDVLVLTEQPGARRVRGATGLFHFAVLTPSRFELARSLRQLHQTGWPLDGFADHLVSEALYLTDPDANGIEIYRDRPRAEWPWRGDEVAMTSDPLDLDGILGELQRETEPWTGLDPATALGHMHVHVRDLKEAEEFWTRVIGFDVMQRWAGQAGFVSAGGYHHHLGFNVWAGVGAPPPPPDAVGLRYFILRLASPADRGAILDRAKAAGVAVEATPEGPLLRDPSRNAVVLSGPSS
jgi:catechol 2,3-dioxygenase